MSEDRIQDLLKQADHAAGPLPSGPTDLASRVRHAHRRRRNVRITGTALAAIIALAVGTTLFISQSSSKKTSNNTLVKNGDSQKNLDHLQAEIDQLRTEIETTLAMLEELNAQQEEQNRQSEIRRILAEPDPLEEVHRQLDKAAFIIVYQADRMYRELNLRESAIESYNQAIKLFPQTQWAKVARERLAEIESDKGDQL